MGMLKQAKKVIPKNNEGNDKPKKKKLKPKTSILSEDTTSVGKPKGKKNRDQLGLSTGKFSGVKVKKFKRQDDDSFTISQKPGKNVKGFQEVSLKDKMSPGSLKKRKVQAKERTVSEPSNWNEANETSVTKSGERNAKKRKTSESNETSMLSDFGQSSKKKKKRNSESNETSMMSKFGQSSKKKKKRNSESGETFDDNIDNVKNDSASPNNGSPMKSKKRFTMKKMKSERLAKGLIMLNEKSEKKIYQMKTAMRKKDAPEEEIRTAVNQEPRKCENLYKKRSYDLCFLCHKPGHRFRECPEVVHDNEQGTEVCFRCGSSEHILRRCDRARNKEDSLPFAKCFVCGVQGHLSFACPKNEKGAFPFGGECYSCGSKAHKKKYCPQLNENRESMPTAKIVQAGASADTLDDSDNSE